MKLDRYSGSEFDRGSSRMKEILWNCCQAIFFSSFLPGSGWRVKLLRLFGACIGQGVIVKPGVKVKFPWRLAIADHCWIGENVWIDNLAMVTIGSSSCLSQGVYLCTGSHNWSKDTFDLIIKPIVIGEQVWVGAFCTVAPGVTIAPGSVCAIGSVITKQTGRWEVWAGNPCIKIKDRIYS